MEVRDGVETFPLDYEPFEGDNALSVHVVETEEAVVQFGAGHASTADQVAGIAVENDVDVVVAEHGDGDHYGGVPAVRERFEAAGADPPTVAVPAGDADWVREDDVAVDVALDPGEQYWGVETIDAPGHTPGNMAYLYGDLLVAGDTLLGSDFAPIAVDDWRGAFGLAPPSRNTGGDDAARRSVAALLDYDFETVLVSHGSNVVEGGPEQVELLVEDLDSDMSRTEF